MLAMHYFGMHYHGGIALINAITAPLHALFLAVLLAVITVAATWRYRRSTNR